MYNLRRTYKHTHTHTHSHKKGEQAKQKDLTSIINPQGKFSLLRRVTSSPPCAVIYIIYAYAHGSLIQQFLTPLTISKSARNVIHSLYRRTHTHTLQRWLFPRVFLLQKIIAISRISRLKKKKKFPPEISRTQRVGVDVARYILVISEARRAQCFCNMKLSLPNEWQVDKTRTSFPPSSKSQVVRGARFQFCQHLIVKGLPLCSLAHFLRVCARNAPDVIFCPFRYFPFSLPTAFKRLWLRTLLLLFLHTAEVDE